MNNRRKYKELVFTDHALERLNQRDVTQSEAWATWRRPTKRYYASTKQAWVYQRNWRHRQIEVVAKQQMVRQAHHKEWVVLSVWSNYVAYKKPRSIWKKIWKWILRKITNNK